MKLRDVLKDVAVIAESASGDELITGVVYSSKAVKPGNLFTALKGEVWSGMDFVEEAMRNGAAAVLSEWPKPRASRMPWIQVVDAREAVATAAANFFGHPSAGMKVVGVTGTKGKTTVTYLLEEICKAAGHIPGVIGTIEYRLPGRRIPAGRTTPESTDLQALLKEMLEGGVTHCLMEVSSHALEQRRVASIRFDVAAFTNLSGEHLDYHQSMEKYFEAKKKLFTMNHKRTASVVNIDDPWGKRLVAELPMRTITFGMETEAIVRAAKIDLQDERSVIQIHSPGHVFNVSSSLVGKHNIYNILAAAASALGLGLAPEKISEGIANLQGVPGRFQTIANSRGCRIVVDYAHTDSAMAHLLETAREFRPRRVILVFGAGGSRDTAKRERMGRVAARLADWTILTSDNPRSEDPLEIIAAIEKGFAEEGVKAYDVIPDRKEAIAQALRMAVKGDTILIAGKGHEDYQIFKDRAIPFSDAEVVQDLLMAEEGG